MRYYDITITNAKTGLPLIDHKTQQPRGHWTSYPGGLSGPPDPNALLVELDCLVVDYVASGSKSAITIHGVSLQDITQANDYYGMHVTLSGGMGPGLPLANPQQAGLLLEGTVFESYANWVGTEMNLNLIVTPEPMPATGHRRGNFVFNWRKGQQLQDALTQTIKTAYGDAAPPVVFKLGGSYQAPYDIAGPYDSLARLAGGVQGETLDANLEPTIRTFAQAGKLIFADFQQPAGSTHPIKNIAFTDLVGQPTWIQTANVQITTVLRADIQVGDLVLVSGPGNRALPGGPGFTTIGSTQVYPNQYKYQPAFSLPLLVSELRHIGNSRSPDGGEWVTIMNCQAPTVTGPNISGSGPSLANIA